MYNANHTPGPWHAGGNGTIIYANDGWGVANATVFHWRQEPGTAEANARLIAAAPELLAALEWAVRFIDTYAKKNSGPATPEINKCRAAIAKAKKV